MPTGKLPGAPAEHWPLVMKPFLAGYEDLASPEFEVQIFTMSDAVERLPEIRVGDPVVVRVTEAIAPDAHQVTALPVEPWVRQPTRARGDWPSAEPWVHTSESWPDKPW